MALKLKKDKKNTKKIYKKNTKKYKKKCPLLSTVHTKFKLAGCKLHFST